MQEAQSAADKGTNTIGISEDKIIVLSANDEEQPVAQTASVTTLDENTSAFAVDGLEYYVYNYTTTSSVGTYLLSIFSLQIGCATGTLLNISELGKACIIPILILRSFLK